MSNIGDEIRTQMPADLAAFALDAQGRYQAQWRSHAYRTVPLHRRYFKLMAEVERDIDAAVAATSKTVPCRKGCSACCRSHRIVVTQSEALILVDHIAGLDAPQREALLRRIRAAAAPTAEQSGVACALLHDDACSVHAARPITCRSYVSVSLQQCTDYLAGAGGQPEILALPLAAQFVAVRIARVDKSPRYEINAILARLYGDEALLSRWLADEPSFERDIAV